MKIELQGYTIDTAHITRISSIAKHLDDGIESEYWHFRVFISDGGCVAYRGDEQSVNDKLSYIKRAWN